MILSLCGSLSSSSLLSLLLRNLFVLFSLNILISSFYWLLRFLESCSLSMCLFKLKTIYYSKFSFLLSLIYSLLFLDSSVELFLFIYFYSISFLLIISSSCAYFEVFSSFNSSVLDIYDYLFEISYYKLTIGFLFLAVKLYDEVDKDDLYAYV